MYHVLGWGLGLGSALYGYLRHMYGLSMNQLCWLKQARELFPVDIFVSYFLVMIIAVGFSVGVLITARRSFGEGLPTTVETRRRILSQSSSYAKIFGTYWLAVTGIWVAQHVYMHNSGHTSLALIYIYMALRGLQGPVGALAWFLNCPLTLREIWLLSPCGLRRQPRVVPLNTPSLSRRLIEQDTVYLPRRVAHTARCATHAIES